MTCTTGASAGSFGGATAFLSFMVRTGTCAASARTRLPPRAGPRTPTCSTPGSPPRCGRSRRWAGRTTPPTCAIVTGYDILFFWVVRMMMFGLYAMRERPPADAVPFRVVALHGLVRDQYGKKMSKSRGNTVDPLEWIERFGADAVRFTLARGSNPGSDEAISEDWAAGSRNFCNKLWNATRFALMNGATTAPFGQHDLNSTDRWILSRLSSVIAEVD